MLPGRLPPFGSLLRELRRSAGLTQEELAERARVGVRTLRDLETGRTARPQRSTVDLLAGALELDETVRKDFVVASRGWPGATRLARTSPAGDPGAGPALNGPARNGPPPLPPPQNASDDDVVSDLGSA